MLDSPSGDDVNVTPKTGVALEQNDQPTYQVRPSSTSGGRPNSPRHSNPQHSRLWSPQALRGSQEVDNDRTALLHPFELVVQLLNATGRVRDELLLGLRTRVPCIGRRERVRADPGLSEHVGEHVHGLIERRQVR